MGYGRSPGEPWLTNERAREVIKVAKIALPCVVIVVFLVTFIARTVYVTSREEVTSEIKNIHGPGGRPLPQRRKSGKRIPKTNDRPDFSPKTKSVINWLMVGILLTFLANSVSIIAQTIIFRQENWWCGQSAVVSFSISLLPKGGWPREQLVHVGAGYY